MTITAAAPAGITAPRDTLDVVATFETLLTSRGQIIIARDHLGRTVEFRGTTGWQYNYAHRLTSIIVTETSPTGAVSTWTLPAERQVRDLDGLFA